MLRSRKALFALLGLFAISCATVWAQQPSPSSPIGGATVPSANYPLADVDAFMVRPQTEAHTLAKDFTKATKADEKQEIRKKLGDMLTKQFEANVQHQEKELEQLEKQIAELRSLLKRRQDAKSTIVERRIEQLIQEAEGLGWTAPGANTPRVMYGGSGGGFGGFRPATTPAPAAQRPVGSTR